MQSKLRFALDTMYEMFPNACCELDFKTNEQLAIAVILSAQTTDVSVNKVTPKLFQTFPSMQALADANLEKIEETIKTIGLYRNKAKHIKLFAQQLVQNHDGILPNIEQELTTLAGVGRKTANVIMGVAFHQPALAVDTHVFRVAHRLGLVTQKANVLQTELQLKRKIPKDEWIDAHHTMLFFGRYHCLARQPKCDACPLQANCTYYKHQKTTPSK
ncbi:MAG TPA: endonuclease III [Erysipelotrichaceae bacterium]|nr:endonuclease III [Erysipelotrichaceae bacterium]